MSDNKYIEIDTRLSVAELYEFTMYSNYMCFRGVISVLFSIMSAIGAVVFWNGFTPWQRTLIIIFALMFTLIVPVEYYFRAKKQIKKSFKDSLHYKFDEEGIEISQGEGCAASRWDEVMKVISTKNLIAVYMSPIRAYIIPKSSIGSNFEELKSMMEEKTSCYKFKMER